MFMNDVLSLHVYCAPDAVNAYENWITYPLRSLYDEPNGTTVASVMRAYSDGYLGTQAFPLCDFDVLVVQDDERDVENGFMVTVSPSKEEWFELLQQQIGRVIGAEHVRVVDAGGQEITRDDISRVVAQRAEVFVASAAEKRPQPVESMIGAMITTTATPKQQMAVYAEALAETLYASNDAKQLKRYAKKRMAARKMAESVSRQIGLDTVLNVRFGSNKREFYTRVGAFIRANARAALAALARNPVHAKNLRRTFMEEFARMRFAAWIGCPVQPTVEPVSSSDEDMIEEHIDYEYDNYSDMSGEDEAPVGASLLSNIVKRSKLVTFKLERRVQGQPPKDFSWLNRTVLEPGDIIHTVVHAAPKPGKGKVAPTSVIVDFQMKSRLAKNASWLTVNTVEMELPATGKAMGTAFVVPLLDAMFRAVVRVRRPGVGWQMMDVEGTYEFAVDSQGTKNAKRRNYPITWEQVREARLNTKMRTSLSIPEFVFRARLINVAPYPHTGGPGGSIIDYYPPGREQLMDDERARTLDEQKQRGFAEFVKEYNDGVVYKSDMINEVRQIIYAVNNGRIYRSTLLPESLGYDNEYIDAPESIGADWGEPRDPADFSEPDPTWAEWVKRFGLPVDETEQWSSVASQDWSGDTGFAETQPAPQLDLSNANWDLLAEQDWDNDTTFDEPSPAATERPAVDWNDTPADTWDEESDAAFDPIGATYVSIPPEPIRTTEPSEASVARFAKTTVPARQRAPALSSSPPVSSPSSVRLQQTAVLRAAAMTAAAPARAVTPSLVPVPSMTVLKQNVDGALADVRQLLSIMAKAERFDIVDNVFYMPTLMDIENALFAASNDPDFAVVKRTFDAEQANLSAFLERSDAELRTYWSTAQSKFSGERVLAARYAAADQRATSADPMTLQDIAQFVDLIEEMHRAASILTYTEREDERQALLDQIRVILAGTRKSVGSGINLGGVEADANSLEGVVATLDVKNDVDFNNMATLGPDAIARMRTEALAVIQKHWDDYPLPAGQTSVNNANVRDAEVVANRIDATFTIGDIEKYVDAIINLGNQRAASSSAASSSSSSTSATFATNQRTVKQLAADAKTAFFSNARTTSLDSIEASIAAATNGAELKTAALELRTVIVDAWNTAKTQNRFSTFRSDPIYGTTDLLATDLKSKTMKTKAGDLYDLIARFIERYNDVNRRAVAAKKGSRGVSEKINIGDLFEQLEQEQMGASIVDETVSYVAMSGEAVTHAFDKILSMAVGVMDPRYFGQIFVRGRRYVVLLPDAETWKRTLADIKRGTTTYAAYLRDHAFEVPDGTLFSHSRRVELRSVSGKNVVSLKRTYDTDRNVTTVQLLSGLTFSGQLDTNIFNDDYKVHTVKLQNWTDFSA